MSDAAPTRKTISFISRSTPYGQGRAKACLDMVLSTAVFEQKVNFIFMDDGLWQLKRQQDPASIDSKDLSAAFAALPLYDVDTVYVDVDSMHRRGLELDALVVPATAVSVAQIGELIRQSDVVFSL